MEGTELPKGVSALPGLPSRPTPESGFEIRSCVSDRVRASWAWLNARAGRTPTVEAAVHERVLATQECLDERSRHDRDFPLVRGR